MQEGALSLLLESFFPGWCQYRFLESIIYFSVSSLFVQSLSRVDLGLSHPKMPLLLLLKDFLSLSLQAICKTQACFYVTGMDIQ